MKLPFDEVVMRQDEEEEDDETILTMNAWAVDIADLKQISKLIEFLKENNLDEECLKHLKRVRKLISPDSSQSSSSLLLASLSAIPTFSAFPALPLGLSLPAYIVAIPRFPATTTAQLKVKNKLWPTSYQPKVTISQETIWTEERVKWVERNVDMVEQEARRAKELGEIPVASLATSFDASSSTIGPTFLAHDTRQSDSHPLHHSTLNLIRSVASHLSTNNAISPTSPLPPLTPSFPIIPPSTPQTQKNSDAYLLTSLTLFTTHEPCIMCTMALLHSRVSEVFYIRKMEGTGGLGGCGVGVPGLDGVNHRFRVWRWGGGGEGEGGRVELRVDGGVDA